MANGGIGVKQRSPFWMGAGLAGLLVTGCSSVPAADPSGLLTSDPATMSADLYLNAGYNSANQWNNYDGYAHGRMVVTVPVGYTIHMHLTNDGGIPYAVGVYGAGNQLAFKGAGISVEAMDFNPSLGVLPGDSETYTFVASTLGTYRIASNLYRFPAHHPTNESLGMWDTMRVVASGNPNVTVQ